MATQQELQDILSSMASKYYEQGKDRANSFGSLLHTKDQSNTEYLTVVGEPVMIELVSRALNTVYPQWWVGSIPAEQFANVDWDI